MEENKKNDDIRVKSTPIFKLKDRERRFMQVINLKKQFGFIPEIIMIEKVRHMNNGLIVRAILTEEEKEREDKIRAEMAKKIESGALPVKNTTDGKSSTTKTK